MWCWEQLLGFSDLATGGMAVCASVGAAIGFLLGGGAGDYLSMRFPNAARPAVNQVSQLLAGPLYVALLKGLPGERSRLSPHCHLGSLSKRKRSSRIALCSNLAAGVCAVAFVLRDL